MLKGASIVTIHLRNLNYYCFFHKDYKMLSLFPHCNKIKVLE